jgi:hypothetical protein
MRNTWEIKSSEDNIIVNKALKFCLFFSQKHALPIGSGNCGKNEPSPIKIYFLAEAKIFMSSAISFPLSRHLLYLSRNSSVAQVAILIEHYLVAVDRHAVEDAV